MKETILLIEDEIELQQNLKEILEFHGFSVITADHGKDGLQKLESFHIDLILCDIMMPIMDGYQFLKAVKVLLQYEHIPFIFLSAKASGEERSKGMAKGADDYLAKPVSSRMLLNSVFAALDKKKEKDTGGLPVVKSDAKIISEQHVLAADSPISSLIDHLELQKLAVENKNWLEVSKENQFALLRATWLNISVKKIGLFLSLPSIVPRTSIILLGVVITELIEGMGKGEFIFRQKLPQKVFFDPHHIRIVFKELLENALKFADPSEKVMVDLEGTILMISNRQNKFKSVGKFSIKPFCNLYTSKESRTGLGLGLFLAKEFCLRNKSFLGVSVDSDQLFRVEIRFNEKD